jgi:hypothetical protein
MSEPSITLVTPPWVRVVLDEFERQGYFDEKELYGRLGRALHENGKADIAGSKAASADSLAFSFDPQPLGETSRWDTHFGPQFTSGEDCEPDIAEVDPSVLAYWEGRMAEARHPILVARYADLLWDLSRAAGARPSIEAARLAADAYAGFGPLADELSAITAADRLRRGLQIALQIRDEPRTECLRDALFALLTRVNRTWGWVNLFDTFEHFTKVTLTDTQRDAITAGLEAHVTEVSGRPEGAQPGTTLPVAGRLSRHYRRLGWQDDAHRVILATGQAAERAAATCPNAVLAHAWLDDVYQVFRGNNLDEDATRVLLAARARGAEAEGQMARITSSVEIDRQELERFADGITEGGLETAIQQIVGHFVPDLDQLRQQLRGHHRAHPIAAIFSSVAQMREGQVVGRCGPADTDPEGALLHAVSRCICLEGFFLACALDRARERYTVTPDTLIDFLYRSPVFPAKFQGLLRPGIDAYQQGDHLKAIHVLVPQIENALRSFLHLIGLPPNKPRRGDTSTMTEKTLTDILEHEPVLREYFGEGIMLYLQGFLADPQGHNIRNRMSHGLMTAEEFNRGISDRVLHILLLLGSIRPVQQSAGEPAPGSGAST